MKRIMLLICAWGLLSVPEPAAAQRFARPGANRPPPGWDWWRIYPWSPYNYGRNPYYGPWNAPPPYYPYPPNPALSPLPPYYSGEYYNGPNAPALAAETNQHVMVPHPTGEVRTPPRDAAVIQVRLPDRFAELAFNGEKTASVGNTRYFVTPELAGDKAYHYVVTAKWTRDGQTVTAERQVDVLPGRTSHVDFTK